MGASPEWRQGWRRAARLLLVGLLLAGGLLAGTPLPSARAAALPEASPRRPAPPSVGLPLAGLTAAPGGQGSGGVIVPTTAAARNPRLDGVTVVWARYREAHGWNETLWDVYGARVADGRPFPVAAGPAGSRSDPVVAGGIVVWAESAGRCETCNRDILGKDLATGRQFVIAATTADETRPAVSERFVVWVSDDGTSRRLLGRDLRAMGAPFVIADGLSRQHRPELVGEHVLWAEERSVGAVARPVFRLLSKRIGAVEPTIVADYGSGFGESPFIDQPDVFAAAGDVVAYRTAHDVRVFDRRTGENRPLTLPPRGYPQGVTTDGRHVLVGMRPVRGAIAIVGYDLATDSAFTVTRGVSEAPPQMWGGVVVWQSTTLQAESRLVIVPAAAILPTAPLPEPNQTSAERTYHAATGHALAHGFRAFWEQGGGLPVFGYPLTEEFEQVNADTGRWHTVQYTERQRFEYHPDLAGTPYEVSLGRLGAEDAAARADLKGLWAFNPVAPDAAHPPGCVYIAAVRHRLCGEFRPHWAGHGLDLGDAGVSEREALALFGYPISEEFIDPRTGLITQYFERAVFEYHPDLPPGQRVLLRRLGAERLAAIGW